MLIAQISDPHIHTHGEHAERIQPEYHLAAAVNQLNQQSPPPDLVVVTGDLVEHGRSDEYQRLKRLLDGLQMPYVLIAGNHDDPDTLRSVFTDHAYLQHNGTHLQYTLEFDALRLIGLDTTVPRKGWGALCANRLSWLEQTLAQAPDQRTLILMHHPPFDTGIAEMDKLGLLEGRQAFVDLITPYTNIERILCGHIHRSVYRRVGNTVASTCPGTAHQIVLDLTGGELQFNFEPPGYQLHWLSPEGVVTHHAVIGNYAGPYRY